LGTSSYRTPLRKPTMPQNISAPFAASYQMQINQGGSGLPSSPVTAYNAQNCVGLLIEVRYAKR
jgi:hypothetical protein